MPKTVAKEPVIRTFAFSIPKQWQQAINQYRSVHGRRTADIGIEMFADFCHKHGIKLKG